MKTAQYAVTALAFIVLHEMYGADQPVEIPLRERFEKIASCIVEQPRFDNHYAFDGGLNDFHNK